MVEITRKLSNLANALDAAELSKLASVVDGVNKRSLDMKKAQYEGLQGYWIRNRRCWENCYRQKRAKTSLPAQEVWTECHQEYVDSLGKEGTKWDKYASGLNFTKTANKQKISEVDERFRKQVESHVKKGLDVPSAVFATIEEETDTHIQAYVAEAERMAKVASVLKSQGKDQLSSVAASASEDLYKEAQLFQKLKDWGKNKIVDPLVNKVKQKGRQWTGNANVDDVSSQIGNMLKQVQNLRTRFPADMSNLDQQTSSQLDEQYSALTQSAGSMVQNLANMTKKNPASGRVYQSVAPAFQQFSNASDPKSRRLALDAFGNALNKAMSESQQVGQVPNEMATEMSRGQNNPAMQNKQQLGPELMTQEQQQQSREEALRSQGLQQDQVEDNGAGGADLTPEGTIPLADNPAAGEASDGSSSALGDEQPMTNMNEGAPPSEDVNVTPEEAQQAKSVFDSLNDDQKQWLLDYAMRALKTQEQRSRIHPQKDAPIARGIQQAVNPPVAQSNDRRSVKTSSSLLGVEGKQFLSRLKKEF